MKLKTNHVFLTERRTFTRLDHIFPVEIQFFDTQKQAHSGWYQAFTQDVSQGGVCLTINHLKAEDVYLLVDKNAVMFLDIHIPLRFEAIRVTARTAWFKKLKDEPVCQYLVGFSYEKIEPKDNERILRYVAVRKLFKALAITLTLFLGMALVGTGFYSAKLRYENERLLMNYQKTLKVSLEKPQEVSLVEKKVLDKLYRWLVLHQNNHTGLIASYEGDTELSDWAFTYDQALAAIVFVKAGDIENARKIFDFYLTAEKTDGGFINAYYASTGATAEYAAHAGPNIWLGLAILQYTHKTKDRKYLILVEDISRWLETIKDSEGGLMGGKGISWYSTEHNLDAYAFYKMMFEIAGEEKYDKAGQRVLAWLNKNAYSQLANPVVNRGKGDSTIATDTYAWSVTAIGPLRLKAIGMDPDGIIDVAITHCGVHVKYKKPNGPAIDVKGFDFAKYQNLARGGVVSCEWTAQMVLAFKIMAAYHSQEGRLEKARYYTQLANEYISELSKMMTTSPSPVGQGEFCLPYASEEFVDTGHGWRTPRGDRTGSVAATAYAILAIEGINPLQLSQSQ